MQSVRKKQTGYNPKIILPLIIICLLNIPVSAQNFWEETAGPEGGLVQCLALSPSGTVYAGFTCGQYGGSHLGKALYRTDNDAYVWTPIVSNFNKDIRSIVVDSLGRIVIWSTGAGIYRSTDNGVTWLYPGFPVWSIDLAQLGVFRNNTLVITVDNQLFFSTNNGISWDLNQLSGDFTSLFVDHSDNLFVSFSDGPFYKSTDYGYSWIPLQVIGSVGTMCEAYDRLLFASTYAGIFVSNDSGNNWTSLPWDPSNGNIVCMTSGMPHQLFAGTQFGMYLSDDEGHSWRLIDAGIKGLGITSCLRMPSGQVIAGTLGAGIFSYDNDENRWRDINSGIESVNVRSFYKYNGLLFTATEQGVLFRSPDNGDNWTRLDSVFSYSSSGSFASTGLSSLFYASSAGLFKSTDSGDSWIRIPGLFPVSVEAVRDTAHNKEYVFCAVPGVGTYRSEDDGVTWTLFSNGLGQHIIKLCSFYGGPVFAVSYNEIYRTTDFGGTWENVFIGDPSVYHIDLAASSNGYLYAGFDWGTVSLSTDYGDTWMDRGEDLPVNRVNSVAVDSLNRVYIGNWDGKIFQSVDDGEHWLYISSGMIGGPVLNLYCDNSGNIFVGPYGGSVYKGVNNTFVPQPPLLYSPPSGQHNAPLTPGFTWFSTPGASSYRIQCSLDNSFDTSDVIFDYVTSDTTAVISDSLEINTDYLWRVSCSNQFGWSLWSTTFWFKTLDPTAVKIDQEKEFSYELMQNYPNPFNPTTSIRYEIRNEGMVQLKVYDILGKEVETLVNGRQPAGTHSVQFNGSKLSSGIYFYQLKAGSFTQTRKLLLVK